jgi:antitoxin HicB
MLEQGPIAGHQHRLGRAREQIPLPPLAAAKLALCEAMRRQEISNAELARRLGITEAVVRRLVDPDHASRIERVQAALAALGVELVVEEAA